MERYKLLIRADGGKAVGMGHLMRTGVIAQCLKKDVDIEYICNSKYKDGIKWLEDQKYKVHRFEEKELLEEILKLKAELILTDNYTIDFNYIKQLRETFKIVGYIDDNVQNKYQADFIINQNYKAEDLIYKGSNVNTKLLGSHYLLIREEFRKTKNIAIRDNIKNILVTVGGTDVQNLTYKILSYIKSLPYNFHVVVGMTFPYEEQLRLEFRNNKNIIFYKQPPMQELMIKCDMAISSCGSTLYELGVIGVPIIGISIAENQKGLAQRMYDNKMISYIGDIEEVSRNQLISKVSEVAECVDIREKMSRACINQLNKKGAELVVKEIKKMLSTLA